MTGTNKKMNYPVFYHIRVKKQTLKALKKIGSKKVREYLEKSMEKNQEDKNQT